MIHKFKHDIYTELSMYKLFVSSSGCVCFHCFHNWFLDTEVTSYIIFVQYYFQIRYSFVPNCPGDHFRMTPPF